MTAHTDSIAKNDMYQQDSGLEAHQLDAKIGNTVDNNQVSES